MEEDRSEGLEVKEGRWSGRKCEGEGERVCGRSCERIVWSSHLRSALGSRGCH